VTGDPVAHAPLDPAAHAPLDPAAHAPLDPAAHAPLDPAALQVLVARCAGIAEEMGAVLVRSGFSPNIKERADCSTALFTAAGEVLAQAEHIPVHLGSMPAAVAAAIAAWGDAVRPGDQIIANDPYAGGTHCNDVTLVAPVFLGGTIVGWAANRAHHADVGGTAPGSMPADALTIEEEGIRLAPVLLDHEVEERFVAASRTPDERRGDLAAQVGTNAIGCARLAALVDRIGGTRPLEEVVDYGERRMRAALRALPDGVYVFSDVIDSLGPRVTQQLPAVIVVTVTIADGRVTFDFTGTAAQRPGNMNAVEAVTVSAVAFALRCATDPTIPANGGAMRPVRVVAPPGTLVAAQPPVAVGAGNVEVSQRIADVCLGALAQAAPDRVGAAGQGTMNNLLIGRDAGSDGPPWVYYETVGGGQGGRPGRGGMHGVHTGMTNSRNTPVEVLERTFPLRVVRQTLRRASGGAGQYPGGDGIERDLLVLEDVTVSLITERRASRPWGLAGGGAGAPGENWLLPGGDEDRAERLPDKCTRDLRAGDVLRMRTPGGGGWGADPGARLRPRAGG
jgi:N-methylhydantoinase B/oxoprolinase/acetone carboxylase alpha subunit